MEIKSDIIIKGAIAFVSVFVLGKILGEVIRGLAQTASERLINGKKENDQDLDTLINRKIIEMKASGNQLPSSKAEEVKNSKSTDKNSSEQKDQVKLSAIKIYQKAFAQATKENDEKKIKEYKLALELFDHLQWGEGKHYKIIESMCKQNYALPVTTHDISLNFKEMNTKNIFDSLDIDKPLGYTALTSLIGHKSAFDQMIKKITEGIELDPSLIKMTTMGLKSINPIALYLALYLLSKRHVSTTNIDFSSEIDCFLSPPLIRKKIMALEKRFPLNQFIQFVLTEKKSIKSTMEIQDNLVKLASFLTPVIPFPDIAKKDLDAAKLLLQVNDKDDFAIIKKNYKNLVATRHPDKFQSQVFPKEIIAIINENFLKIQASFDMIKKEMGEDE